MRSQGVSTLSRDYRPVLGDIVSNTEHSLVIIVGIYELKKRHH